MRRYATRALAALCAAALLLGLCALTAGAAGIGTDKLGKGFWTPFNAYQKAVEGGDAAAVVSAGDKLLDYLNGLAVTDQSVNQALRVYNDRYAKKRFEALGYADKAAENEQRLWDAAMQLISMGHTEFTDTIAVLAYASYERAEAAGNADALLAAGDRMLAYYALLPADDKVEENIMKIYAARFNARLWEKRGDYARAAVNALEYLTRAEDLTAKGKDYADSVIACRAHLDVLTPFTGVYALSRTARTQGVPAGAPEQGTYYGSTSGGYLAGYEGGAPSGQGSAVSYYVEFGKDDVRDHLADLRALNASRMLLIILNFPKMGATARALAAGELDGELNGAAQALAALERPFLVRIGGEMNIWGEEDAPGAAVTPADFIRAYRRAAERLRAACPNAQLVWSPMQGAKWNETHEDYWPGDDVVDWVGMSLYFNLADVSGQSTAWVEYGRSGPFTDPVAKAEKVMLVAEKHGKPVIVTESGSNKNGTGGESAAARLVGKELSTLNMVWPQVKAVLLFDRAIREAEEDRDFSMTAPGAYRDAVMTAAAANPALIPAGQESAGQWTALGAFAERAEGSILLGATGYTYGDTDLSVTWKLNGKTLSHTDESPNHCALDCALLGGDASILEVEFKGEDGWSTTRRYAVTRTLSGMVTFIEGDHVAPFRDVGATDYFAAPVRWAVEKKLTSGTSQTTFSPEDTCTRAHILTFLWRAHGSPATTVTENPFTDMSEKDYYYRPALWAYEKGMLPAGALEPDKSCVRGEAVYFMWKAEGLDAQYAGSGRFADVSAASPWNAAVGWAVAGKVTSGTSQTTFSPMDPITRGQSMTFLYRALAGK